MGNMLGFLFLFRPDLYNSRSTTTSSNTHSRGIENMSTEKSFYNKKQITTEIK